MIAGLPDNIDQIKGFLADDEAQALYQHARQACAMGPVLEGCTLLHREGLLS